jgi:phage shock protein PspC (stress-responsive transcriptional regulator)
MNEVTQIHLGRQAYTIAADAHVMLRAYLRAIKEEAGSDVADEVELRMAELLTEQGVTGEKVVLVSDIDGLKKQLGLPQDFKDEDGSGTEGNVADTPKGSAKRLFRDTQNGMVAGVASGLGAFLGIDVALVRIIFIIMTLAWGGGLLVYLALWLLVPEANSSSDRLRMQGKAVTVESLKHAVKNADVPGAAERFVRNVSPIVNGVFRSMLKIAGAGVVLVGLLLLFGLITGSVYLALHHWKIIAENFFPVGASEHLAVAIGLTWLALLALLTILIGVAMMRHKWPTAPWATGVLIGLLFVGSAVGISLAADIAPKVQSRVEAAHHTTTLSVANFSSLVASGNVMVDVEQSNNYRVSMSYIGNPDISKVYINSTNDILRIDSSGLKDRSDCTVTCMFPDYDLKITVYTPVAPKWDSSTSPMQGFLY